MTVDCSNDDQWAAYLRENPAVKHAEHLRPSGVHDLPVPRIDRRVRRRYSLVISGPPGTGKAALLDLMKAPPGARLPAIVPGADPESGPAGLSAYGDLVAARGHRLVLESSVWDTYGPYALRLLARGFSLDDDFKAKGIRVLTEAHQTAEHLMVQLVTDPPFGAQPRRDIYSLFHRHHKQARGVAQVASDESPADMLAQLMQQCWWFFQLTSQ